MVSCPSFLTTRASAASSATPSAAWARTVTATLAAGALVLGGCAGMSDPTGLLGGKSGAEAGGAKPAGETGGTAPLLTERVADGGPAAPTAVVEESFTLDGPIMPVTRGQSRAETRVDRRRTDAAVTFDNWLMRRLAPDGRTSDIVRIDRSLVWNLVPAKREYTECPITGCRSGKQEEESKTPAQQEQDRQPDCPVKLTANDLKVTPTGESRNVNGFATDRYRMDWLIRLTDNTGQSTENRVQLDLWTTPETGAVKEVQAINETFNRRYASAITGGNSPVARFLPKNITAAMGSLMRNIDGNDKQTLARWEAELKKLRGYPIATTMSWSVDGRICGAGRGDAQQPSAASLGGMLGSMLGGRKADEAAAPLITFSHEVKSLSVKPVSDSVFAPPTDFRRTN